MLISMLYYQKIVSNQLSKVPNTPAKYLDSKVVIFSCLILSFLRPYSYSHSEHHYGISQFIEHKNPLMPITRLNVCSIGNTPRLWFPCLRTDAVAEHLYLEDPKSFKPVFSISLLPPSFRRHLCMYRTSRVIPPYFMNPFNYMDILIMTFIVGLLVVHAVSTAAQHASVVAWQSPNVHDDYVDISSLLWLIVIRQHILALLLFMCYIKGLEYMQISENIAIPVIVIEGMLRELVTFFVIFAVFLLAFGLFNYILYGLTYSRASTVVTSFFTSFRSSLGDIDFDGVVEVDRNIGLIFTVLAAFLLVILLLNLLVAVMSEAYNEVKETAEARWCYLQFRMIIVNTEKINERRLQRRGFIPRKIAQIQRCFAAFCNKRRRNQEDHEGHEEEEGYYRSGANSARVSPAGYYRKSSF